ncbi:MAG: transporter substrate-binding domain-containing protein [Rhodobacter sp.]|nr:transporter substrate-binding domain-containing protein [Rhodobacter sp.]
MLRALSLVMLAVSSLVFSGLARPAQGQTPGQTQALSPEVAAYRAQIEPRCGTSSLPPVEERIVCQNEIRIGVRTDYPRFGTMGPTGLEGYEIEIAREIGRRLGVHVQFEPVTPVTRLSAVTEGTIDLVLATMGHNTQRDPSAFFLRPHYYSSETIIVGPRGLPIQNWDDMAGRMVCTTVGNYSNVLLAPNVGRLMLFSRPQTLIEALNSELCPMIAQDNTLLVPTLGLQDDGSRYQRLLGFAAVPWGMAMALDTPPALATAMSNILADMHRDGTFVRLASAQGLPVQYLIDQQARWNTDQCRTAPDSCLDPPLEMRLDASPVADLADRLEALLTDTLGVNIRLGFMESEIAWETFIGGLKVSLLVVVLSVVGVVLVGLGLARLLISPRWLVRLPAQVFVLIFQNYPMYLILVLMGTLSAWALTFSYGSAMLAAVAAISTINGAFAGQAVAEAYRIVPATSGQSRFQAALAVASSEIDAYIVNAVRGISAASIIGVPDLLNAINGVTAFSGSQTFYYWLLLVFYVAIVFLAGHLTKRALPLVFPGWR